MRLRGLGLDILEIRRFDSFKKGQKSPFLSGSYTKRELDYCFSFRDAAPHLAGTFAAKEAVFKTLGQKDFLFSSVEIVRKKNGQPTVWINNRLQRSILLSISHTNKIAAAIAIKK